MAQELILIRGPSGSGKSTFAERLCNAQNALTEMDDWFHFEADMFFVENGQYKFDPTRIGMAHYWCQDKTANALEAGHSVIVSNTFTRLKEMEPYFKMAKDLDVQVTVLHIEGNHGNVHNLSAEQVQKQRDRWEPYNG